MPSDQISVPAVFMRGGSSRGAVIDGRLLPADPGARDRFVVAAYGSPDARQIDGVGGADPLTSKVAVVVPSQRPDADVDYTFGQVSIATPEVFWVGNCGNMLSAVAAFAVDEGFVEPMEPITRVRIYTVNVDQVVIAEVPTVDGVARTSGDTEVAGVPGTGAAIMLDFGDCGGAVTGRLLPTGSPVNVVVVPGLGAVEISIVDAATTFVYVRASDLGVAASITPDAMAADAQLLERLESIRSQAAELSGIVDDAAVATERSPSIPRVTMLGPVDAATSASADIQARQMSMQRPHKTYAVTNAVCTAVATEIPGTIANTLVAPRETPGLRIAHPAGVLFADSIVAPSDGPDGFRIERAAVARTARRLMKGDLFVPADRL